MQRIREWVARWVETLACYMTPGFRASQREADEDIRNGNLVPFDDWEEPDHEELGGVPGRRLTEDEWEYLYDEAKVARKEAEIARKREEQG